MKNMIECCTKKDFDQILQNLEEFWGDRGTERLHHPIFIHEFGNTAFVIKENGQVIAYLFGFLSQTEPIAYVHLVGVKNKFQRQGLGQKLYEHFIDYAREKGCQKIKAITSPKNRQSIEFHRKMGMSLLGNPEVEPPVVKNYSGPGLDRVVFLKSI
jgi:L-amino acid N-acyltransferase YncA